MRLHAFDIQPPAVKNIDKLAVPGRSLIHLREETCLLLFQRFADGLLSTGHQICALVILSPACIIVFAYLHASDRNIVPFLDLNVICQMIKSNIITERGPINLLFPPPTIHKSH